MSENSFRTNPLIVIAATTVILTCLLAIGVMTGIIPSPMARDRAVVERNVEAPAASTTSRSNFAENRSNLTDNRANVTDNRSTARAPAPAPRERVAATPPAGSTRSPAPSNTVAGSGPGRNVAAVCNNCGTVTSVRVVKRQGDAGLLGPIAGGAVGGLVGSQIGGGSGKTIATIAGAAGGAALGTEMERRHKATSTYVVNVRLNDGTTRSFNYGSAPGVQQGDRIRVVDDRLVRDS